MTKIAEGASGAAKNIFMQGNLEDLKFYECDLLSI